VPPPVVDSTHSQASAITESPSWTSVFVAFTNQNRLCRFDAACAQISPLACTGPALDTLGITSSSSSPKRQPFCRQRFFDTDELFTKSRQPFCSTSSHILIASACPYTKPSFPCSILPYSINIGGLVYQRRSAKEPLAKHPQFEDPTRLSNYSYIWFTSKRVRSATLQGFGFSRLRANGHVARVDSLFCLLPT
jgi:hypothetical protein